MRIYRMCREKRAKSFEEAFNGAGASKIGGRWNPKGMPAVYTSESTSLALLEILVHADLEDLPDDLVCVSVHIPDSVNVYELSVSHLPKNWRNIDPAPWITIPGYLKRIQAAFHYLFQLVHARRLKHYYLFDPIGDKVDPDLLIAI